MTKKSKSKSKNKKKAKAASRKFTARRPMNPEDIVQLILNDHLALKRLIKVMKDSEAGFDERRNAFEQFAPLLVAHAKPEEQILYTYMKKNEDLREEGFEGEVEHVLADQMVEEVKRGEDHDQLGAKIKVLAELVEHHIKEEEGELLPNFKKHSNEVDRCEMGRKFLDAKGNIEEQGSDDAPSEREIEAHPVI